MKRRNFAQVLKEAKIDIKREYKRLYDWFYKPEENIFHDLSFDLENHPTLAEKINSVFLSFPFRDTCTSLDDFDESHGFFFEECPKRFNIDYLVNFCEYLYNLVIFSQIQEKNFIFHIEKVIDKIGYMKANEEKLYIFVPRSQPAIIVSEILPPNLSYKVIEYNHHSMKGDLERKKVTLKLLADKLELEKNELKSVDAQLHSDLFYLFNNINIRHNNPKNVNSVNILGKELEEWYDYTYELCLLAFMEIEHKEHKSKVSELKKKLGDIT